MVLIMLGISLLFYLLVEKTLIAGCLVFCLFIMPFVMYFDYNTKITYKEEFLRRRNDSIRN